jgi:hypothetical protein
MNLLKKSAFFISKPFAAPLAFLFVTVFAYGLSFWRLGFYWDDLPISWIRYQLGSAASIRYFSDSRPIWGLLYQLTSYIFPHNPAYWQLFAMFWRWAGVVALWFVALRLFPRRKYTAFLLSLLVLLYPGFNQQWVSYVYSHFFIVFFFLVFSWYLMLRGKTIPAVVFSVLNLVMLEYFFMLEFIRPFIIFKSLQDEPLTNRERLIRTFKIWLPYIGGVVVAVAYRSLVFSHPGFGYSLTDELVRAPVETLTLLVGWIFSSLWATVAAAWIQTFQFPAPSVSGARTTVLYAVVVLAVGALAFFFKRVNDDQAEGNPRRDTLWLLGLGAILLMLGGVPFWLTNVPISLGFPANRATLSFMLGACFFLIGLIELLPLRVKYLVAVLLVSLSAGRQFLWAVDYMRDWNSHRNLFWQMTWRAPALEKGTMVLINENLEYYADNSLSAALNWIYAPDNHTDVMDYVLFYPTNRSALSLTPGTPVEFDFLAGRYHGSTSQAVVFYYSPPRCLRLLDPEIDSINKMIPDDSLLRDAALLSSTRPISNQPIARMPDVYGTEPTHGWCYYFQKADLARQMGDWETVTKLGDAAFALDDYPNDPVERFVFIEGYAHTADWKKAVELSQASHKVSKNYVAPLLCKLWDRIERETESTPEQGSALDEVRTRFECLP